MPPVLYRSADLGAWKAACAGYCAALRAVSAAKVRSRSTERWLVDVNAIDDKSAALSPIAAQPRPLTAPLNPLPVQKKDDLPELDRWFIRELPAEIAASSPPHVTRRQLSKVMVRALHKYASRVGQVWV